MKKRVLQLSILIIVLFLAVGCSDIASSKAKGPIKFADNGWDSNRFYNEVARFIIENGYDYETEQTSGSTAPLFTGLAENELDVHMEVWTKNVSDIYEVGVKKGDYNPLSVNFNDNYQGLYVPAYMIEGDPERGIDPITPDLKYLSDLPDYWEVFKDLDDPSKGRIVGWLSGSYASEVIQEALKEYGLDEYYNYSQPGSEASLNASLTSAYESGDPWLGYSYEPNWIMGKYDMILIEEEEGKDAMEELESQDVEIAASNRLMEHAPDVVDFLSNFETSSAIANDALTYIQEEEVSEHEAAMRFLKENEDIWTKWVPDDVAESVIGALNES